jgi:hypothetical protein
MDFGSLRPTGEACADGDRAFDEEDFPSPAFAEDEETDGEDGPAARAASPTVERIIARPRVRPPQQS